MSRNYGWGSRNAQDAVRMELHRQALRKNMSFLTAKTLSDRFAKFHVFMRSNGVGKLELVTSELVIEFGIGLGERIRTGKPCAAYAQNLVSAVNTVMETARGSEWEPISPTQDCNIPKRKAVREKPTLTKEQCERAVRYLKSKGYHRAATVAELAYVFGLRSKEASLLDVAKGYRQSSYQNYFILNQGTKGGRKRKVMVSHRNQTQVLKHAVKVQDNGFSIMPKESTWKIWRENGLRQGRDALHALNIKGFHEFRAAYAACRYVELVGSWEAPCNGGKILNKQVDLEARKIIAQELGHNRIAVVSSYIGGRR